MVDDEYSTDNDKLSKVKIEGIMKNSEMLRLVLDYLKTKKMYKYAV